MGNLVRQGIPARQVKPAKGCPGGPCGGHCTGPLALRPVVPCLDGLRTGTEALHAQAVYGVPSQQAQNKALEEQALVYVARQGVAPQLVGGEFHFPLGDLMRAAPSVLATLLNHCAWTRTWSSPQLWAARHSPLSRDPMRIDSLLVDMRLATRLHATEAQPCLSPLVTVKRRRMTCTAPFHRCGGLWPIWTGRWNGTRADTRHSCRAVCWQRIRCVPLQPGSQWEYTRRRSSGGHRAPNNCGRQSIATAERGSLSSRC